MNIIICHGYAHRLRETGQIESTPTFVGPTGTTVVSENWIPRSSDSMDLAGGDIEFIRETLERYAHLFADGMVRLPHSQPTPLAQPAEPQVR